jgi:feruloyl-CoA synthase
MRAIRADGESSPSVLGALTPSLVARPDGSFLVRSAEPLPDYPRRLGDGLRRWAREAPDRVFLAERNADRSWRKLTYAETLDAVTRIAAALLKFDLSPERPIVVLSGNDVEHALIGLAAMEIGVPYCPISPPYSLASQDFAKLRFAFNLLTPGLVYATDGAAFARAFAAVAPPGVPRVVARGADAADALEFADLLAATPGVDFERARAAVGPDTIAKFLLTSGSTGRPKAVINTQRMICANQAMLAQAFPFFDWEPPVLLDWLPWSHTFGSNHNFGIALVHGGTFHFDGGRPMPGGVEETVANLREIAPTAYFNVPKGFEALLPHLEADAGLRAHVFSRLKMLFYAGAGLAPEIFHVYRAMAKRETGRDMPFVTGLGATETSPSALMCLMDVDEPGNMGQPMAGVELKLAPIEGKLEARVRAPTVTPGYWRDDELTRKAFDDEGFYRFGDALRFAAPGDPRGGFLFDGRIAEDFKLATGTWVSVGPLRAALVSALAPLARDAVIAGHDRDDVAALIFPDLDACRMLADADDLDDPKVREAFRKRLAVFAGQATGSAARVERILLLADPPSLDAGEITDKGSLNQRAALQRRTRAVAALYDPESEAPIRAH